METSFLASKQTAQRPSLRQVHESGEEGDAWKVGSKSVSSPLARLIKQNLQTCAGFVRAQNKQAITRVVH